MLPINNIYVCNTIDDCIKKLNIDNFKIDSLHLKLIDEKSIGPISIDIKENNCIVVNKLDGTISNIDLESFVENNRKYICPAPRDIKIYGDYAYISSNETNSIIMYNIIKEEIEMQLKTGISPGSIVLCEEDSKLFCANILEDTITVIDLKENKVIRNIKVGNYPIKIKLSKDKKLLYVCESNLEDDNNGYISIYSLSNFNLESRVRAGKTPVDIYEDKGILYVSDFEGGSINLINEKEEKEEKRLFLGGMPNGILKHEDKLYVTDYFNGNLYQIDEELENLKIIAIGNEPNAMIIV